MNVGTENICVFKIPQIYLGQIWLTALAMIRENNFKEPGPDEFGARDKIETNLINDSLFILENGVIIIS